MKDSGKELIGEKGNPEMVAIAAKLSKTKRIFRILRDFLVDLREAFSNFVFAFFKSISQKNPLRLPPTLWHMSEETIEHVNMVVKVFKFVILPTSLFYVCWDYLFFRENALDSMLLGMVIFVYSSFLPDLPSIYRQRKKKGASEDLPWYKKYALLLFAPLFIWALFAGTRLRWSTSETFHNLKSLVVYEVFLFLIGSVFITLPISMSDIAEIVSIPLYGLIGYLAHLKVDKIL